MPTIHLVIASLTGLTVLYADEQALLWATGRRERFNADTARFLHRVITGGLVLLLITGGLMYIQSPRAYLSLATFDIKMAAVLALILNTYAISRFSEVGVARSFASLSTRERLPLYISGAVSFLGWATAFLCGLLIA